MATQLATDAAAHPFRAIVPFMLSSAPVETELGAALQAAATAESASHDVHRNTRCRVSYFLCDVANQLRQREGFDFADEIPVSRYEISDQLDISLCKVKRVLALLSLSGVLSTDGRRVQVLDWPRLCAVAQVDPARLGLAVLPDEQEDIIVATEAEEPVNLTTANGEPACFV